MNFHARFGCPPRRLAVVPLLLLAGCGGGGGSSSVSGEPVSIQRDASGVPHVFAQTDEGAMYGLGWAAARDRLLQMTQARLMIQGRLAEYFGPGFVAGLGETYALHDVKARQLGWWRHALKATALLDTETLGLLQAYAAGVNAYASKKKAKIHPALEALQIPLDPWRPEDCVGIWLRFGRHLAGDASEEIDRLRQWETLLATPGVTYSEAYDQMVAGVVCNEGAAAVQQSQVPLPVQQAMQDYATLHGLLGAGTCTITLPGLELGQAWAVEGARTTTGKAVLVGEPRLEVSKPNTYYEWSVEGETFSVRGVGLAGSPIVLGGSTPSVAWSPTTLGMDQADLFALVTDPSGHPGQYLVDGFWLDYTVDEMETVIVRGSSDRSVHYRETLWGPVVTPVLTGVFPNEEFALHRTPFVEPDRETTKSFFRMARAADIGELFDALGDWSWPSLNVVFADSNGRVGYTLAGDVPVRRPELDLPGVIPQDGSTLSAGWLGRLPWGLQPHVLDPAGGLVFSANHMPVGSWYPIPIRFGTNGAGDTHRSRRLRELLAALPAIALPDEVSAARLDIVHPGRRDLVELGLWLRDQQATHVLSPEAQSALIELEPWWNAGAPMDDSLPGVVAAWFMDLTFQEPESDPTLIAAYGSGESGLGLFLETAIAGVRGQPAVPLTPEEATYVDRALAAGWNGASGVGPQSSWSSWFQTSVLMFDVAPFKTLEGFQIAAPPASVGPVLGGDPQTLHAPAVQGFTQVVEPGAGTVARSLMPPGVSEHAGKHELNLVPTWEFGELKAAPITRSEVSAAGKVTKTTIFYKPPAP